MILLVFMTRAKPPAPDRGWRGEEVAMEPVALAVAEAVDPPPLLFRERTARNAG
jgi:hypothetical protein